MFCTPRHCEMRVRYVCLVALFYHNLVDRSLPASPDGLTWLGMGYQLVNVFSVCFVVCAAFGSFSGFFIGIFMGQQTTFYPLVSLLSRLPLSLDRLFQSKCQIEWVTLERKYFTGLFRFYQFKYHRVIGKCARVRILRWLVTMSMSVHVQCVKVEKIPDMVVCRWRMCFFCDSISTVCAFAP